MRLTAPLYRRAQTPLHAARAPVGAAYCLALAAAAGITDHPLLLAALALALVSAAIGARSGRALGGALTLVLWLGLLSVAVNLLVNRNGLTVLARLGALPPFGQVDLTLEALVYGLVIALKGTVVVLAGALVVAAVDPDELLRLFRRVSFRSALTASLATRMVPVLAADARRLSDARRCRPDAGARRRGIRGRPDTAIVRALATGALDRAMDVAATLEVRGYGSARRAPVAQRAPWSRHDLAFAASGIAVVGLTAAGRWSGIARFDAYPQIDGAGDVRVALLAVALVVVALAPFAQRRGIAR